MLPRTKIGRVADTTVEPREATPTAARIQKSIERDTHYPEQGHKPNRCEIARARDLSCEGESTCAGIAVKGGWPGWDCFRCPSLVSSSRIPDHERLGKARK